MANHITFEALQNEVQAMDVSCLLRDGTLANRLSNILDRARINADDTVYLEKAAPVEQYAAIAIASVESILAYDNDNEARVWFAVRGIAF